MNKLYITMSFFALFSSCVKNEVSDTTIHSNVIGFSAYAPLSRASDISSIYDLANADGFYVYAYNHMADYPGSGEPKVVMNGEHVRFRGGSWFYYNVKYWPTVGKLSFFGYNAHTNNVMVKYKAGSAATNYLPSIDFTQANSYANHFDLMSAVSPNQTKGSLVTMSFTHTLSRIGFDYGTKSSSTREIEIDPTTIIKIDKVDLMGYNFLYNSGTYSYQNQQWSELKNNNMDTYIDITPVPTANKNYLFLIPQSLAADKCALQVEYTITTIDAKLEGGKYSKTVNRMMKLPAIEFSKGVSYRYIISITPIAVTFEGITTDDWNSSVDSSMSSADVSMYNNVVKDTIK